MILKLCFNNKILTKNTNKSYVIFNNNIKNLAKNALFFSFFYKKTCFLCIFILLIGHACFYAVCFFHKKFCAYWKISLQK